MSSVEYSDIAELGGQIDLLEESLADRINEVEDMVIDAKSDTESLKEIVDRVVVALFVVVRVMAANSPIPSSYDGLLDKLDKLREDLGVLDEIRRSIGVVKK